MKIYRTAERERLYDIATSFRINPIILSEINEIDLRRTLPKNLPLIIPEPTKNYTAKKGDTIKKIAERFKTSINQLLRYNPTLNEEGLLYEGQPLIIRQSAPYCKIATNGYCNKNTDRRELIRRLPYITFVTVCTGVLSDQGFYTLFDDSYVTNLAKQNKKGLFLRVYIKVTGGENDCQDRIENFILYAKSRGYWGVVLSSDDPGKAFLYKNQEKITEKANENRLAVFFELSDSDKNCHGDIPCGIISYDKYDTKNKITFDDGERAFYQRFTDENDVSRCFLDISSYAPIRNNYLSKRDILKLCGSRSINISYDGDCLIDYISFNNKKGIYVESVENTKAKLDLICELGWLGVSFDISSIPTRELYMIASIFDIADKPTMFFS